MLYLNGKSKKSNLQRFQCLLQRIVFDAGIGDAVLKNSANVTILKSLIYLSFLIATASMINYYQSHTSCIYMSHMPVTFLSVNTTVYFLFLSSSSKGVVQEQKELWKYVKGNT